MDREQLEAVGKRCEEATRAPWRETVNTVDHLDGMVCADFDWLGNGEANKRFIAHARTDIPFLLDHIEAQERRIENLEDELKKEPITVWGDVPSWKDARITELERRIEELEGVLNHIADAPLGVGPQTFKNLARAALWSDEG